MKPQAKYDKKLNVLSIRMSKRRNVDSEVRGNIVIDYDENGRIVNIDIMKINLDEFTGSKKLFPLRELIKT